MTLEDSERRSKSRNVDRRAVQQHEPAPFALDLQLANAPSAQLRHGVPTEQRAVRALLRRPSGQQLTTDL